MQHCRIKKTWGGIVLLSMALMVSGSDRPPIYWGFRPFYGIVMNESANEDRTLHPYGIEMDLAWHFTGEKAWNTLYSYPRAGISALYANFDSPGVLGRFTGIYPFFEPFLYAHSRVSASVKIGAGVGYTDKLHDAETNPENIYFSTHLNFIQFVRFGVHIKLSEQLNGTMGVHYFHSSNSGAREPNIGLEVGAIHAGIDYNLGTSSFRRQVVDRKPPFDKKRLDLVGTSLGTVRVNKERSKPLLWGLNLSARKYIIGLSAISAGLEMVSDGEAAIGKDNRNAPGGHKNFSCLLGHEFMFHRFLVSQQLGYYLGSGGGQDETWFQRYGISYLFFKNLAFGMNLKMHGKTGDYLDFRLSYYWRVL